MSNRVLHLELRNGRVRPTVARTPVFSSAAAGWSGFIVEHHHFRDFHVEDVCALSHLVILQLGSPVAFDWSCSKHRETSRIEPGQLSILPAAYPYSARGAGRMGAEFLLVGLEHAFVAGAAAEYGMTGSIHLSPTRGQEDPLMREVVLSLNAEAARPNEGPLYAQSLATLLAVHLVRKYSALPLSIRPAHRGLAKTQLRRCVEYIHAHYAGDLSIPRLATVAELSPFHFARRFKQSTGLSPHAFVTRCRVERARELMLRPFHTLTDIALQVGFYDQSHLARHFKRAFGLTPAQLVRSTNRRP